MKKSDIATVIIIAIIGFLASFFGCKAILGNPDEKSVSFKTVNVIQKEVADPDPEVFNSEAINPTVEVFVGECEDIDHNGMLDQAELMVCNEEQENVEVETQDTENQEEITQDQKDTEE